jgi:hypothetical protein
MKVSVGSLVIVEEFRGARSAWPIAPETIAVLDEDPSTALSAVYYAMLYCARAALSERGIQAKTHRGAPWRSSARLSPPWTLAQESVKVRPDERSQRWHERSCVRPWLRPQRDILRSPADAISSIQRRPDPELSIGAWGDLWLEYTARALGETQGRPRTLVFYEDFFHDAQGQLAAMASLLGLQPPSQNGLDQRLCEEVEQRLRHHATSSRELAATWGVPPAARTLFLALRAAEDARRAASGHEEQVSEAIERIAPELWWERRTSTDLRLSDARQASVLQDEQRTLSEAVARAHEEATELRTLIGQEREQSRNELEGTRRELEDARSELMVSAARCGDSQAALAEFEDRLQRQGAILEKAQSSLSWRVTAPLRVAKRAGRRLRPIRRRSPVPARNQSLLAGMSVSQVWWVALLLTSIIAATDAIFTHIVLITLLAAGPFCGLLTGRWARTAAVGAWAVALAVVLGFPDGIWGTRIQMVDLGTVASVALLSTLAATLIERRLYCRPDDLQTLR